MSVDLSGDQYFSSNPAPDSIHRHAELVRDFIASHPDRRIALVTSGGTTVPLEKRTVRFIDNFSAGTRGAKSAEHFLDAGYAVIFMHREFSLTPYAQHWSHLKDGFLGLLTEDPTGVVTVDSERQQEVLRVFRKYKKTRDDNLLLLIPFTTVTDYLHELRSIARLLDSVGSNGLLYLAAAVSDFFIPPDRMSEHKIQSTDAADATPTDKVAGKGGENDLAEEEFDNFDSCPPVLRSKRLVIDLDPVPKFLKALVEAWAPGCMVVSFKLETDPNLLIEKAKIALARYQHDLVVGNLLETRQKEVVFVTPGGAEEWIRLPKTGEVKEIEGLIVPAIIRLHDEYIKSHDQKK
ncbi:hypothetical protein VTK73DRAFT_10153 [Phialemonium thermophilum]|uniref:DNA/pantothenate metabolism flavoprotein C-terminal domain-containing protein n=1 Tax=Phialemonium thermophilum TaxID=223376 RepID=A0ABR3XH77_9PEZI